MKTKLFLIALTCAFAISAFAQTMPRDADPKLWEKALKIHQKAVIIDGHNDITTPMFDDNFGLATDSRGKFHIEGTPYHTDLARLKRSGITGEFFSIYVDKDFVKTGGSARRALDLIDTVYREVEKHPDQLMLCTSSADVYRAKKAGKTCAFMGIEGGHAIEDSLFALRNFYRLGVRYMTLTHNNTNNWADACCDKTEDGKPYKPYGGLNDFGKKVVGEMNRLGMLVDISHVSDDTMRDVLEVSTAPVIFSHSSARKFSDHPRDVPDDILKMIPKNGGIVMINFYPAFLDQRYLDEDRARDKNLESQVKELKEKYKTDEAAFNVAKRELYDANPIYLPPYTRIVDHIDHIRDVAGIDYVGIGSDFDGVPSLPAGMNGAEDLALVTYEMLKRGYSESDILKVLGGNFVRVFEKAEQIAQTNSREISGEGSLEKLKK